MRKVGSPFMPGMGLCHPPWAASGTDDPVVLVVGMAPPMNCGGNWGIANMPLPGTYTIIIGTDPKLVLGFDPGGKTGGVMPNGNDAVVNMKPPNSSA